MLTIHLKNVELFGHHGVYEGESIAGGWFVIDLSVTREAVSPITNLDQTVNYADLFELVKEEMKQPKALLETVAESICTAIKQQFPDVHQIQISIFKKKPPIPNFKGSTGITLVKSFPVS